MPCYRPLKGYYARKVNDTGKRSLVFNVDEALLDVPVKIPCGRCIGCRLDRSLSWALRCMHEASLHEDNCFITLTFDDEHLDSSLRVADFQKFMKRFRQAISPTKVRFFHCGEYGANFGRPHHHACIFGYDFPDKKIISEKQGVTLYSSCLLSDLWPMGFSSIGALTFDSAAYVARYVLKKWAKENLEGTDLYDAMCAMSNEDAKKLVYGDKHEEYVTMSRKPGIGSSWYDQFSSDVYPAGFCVVDGKKVKPPKFYDGKYELDNVFGHALLKGKRVERALQDPGNNKIRLQVAETIKKQKMKQLTRRYEDGTESF